MAERRLTQKETLEALAARYAARDAACEADLQVLIVGMPPAPDEKLHFLDEPGGDPRAKAILKSALQREALAAENDENEQRVRDGAVIGFIDPAGELILRRVERS